MNANLEDSAMPDDGDSDPQTSETVNDNNPADDPVKALLESNRLLQQVLLDRNSQKHRVYVPMPEKFDGKVGDLIEAWLEQFETWFRHREQIEGPMDDRIRVETAIQNTKSEISLDLSRHEADYGKWATWEAFSEYMKEAYGSTESGYTRYIRLQFMTQGNDSVNTYYGRFRRMLNRQKKTMKHPEDKHIYHYMFIAGLKPKINAEVLRLPEAIKMEEMKFNEVLELAKRAEQTIDLQLNPIKRSDEGRKVKTKGSANSHGSHSINISREKLTPTEKTFLTYNIKRGGGMVINEGLRKKFEWIKWAKKDGVCIVTSQGL
jgi:hypothetical protein